MRSCRCTQAGRARRSSARLLPDPHAGGLPSGAGSLRAPAARLCWVRCCWVAARPPAAGAGAGAGAVFAQAVGAHSRTPHQALLPPPSSCSDQALLHAAETRTSAPLRIDRTVDSLESVSMPGLYPCGEGEPRRGAQLPAYLPGSGRAHGEVRFCILCLTSGPAGLYCWSATTQALATQAASYRQRSTGCAWAAPLRQSSRGGQPRTQLRSG